MFGRLIKGRNLTTTVLALLLALAGSAQARVYIVTDTNDSTRITSLRGAVIDATSPGRKDRFNLILLGGREPYRKNTNGLTFFLTIPGADETNSRTGDLDIIESRVTIMPIRGMATINASGLGDRVFRVFPRAQLTLQNLTITGGKAPSGYEVETRGESAGAIFNSGYLFMWNCRILGNSAGTLITIFRSADAGGIYNNGHCVLSRCIIANNTAGSSSVPNIIGNGLIGGDGGGIYNSGTMVLESCIVSNNSSGNGSAGGYASGDGDHGAIAIGSGGTGGDGGGIYNSGNLKISFCTINGNFSGSGGYGEVGGAGSGGKGGGIFNIGSLTLNTCTISSNYCGAGGMGYGAGPASWNAGAGGNGGSGGAIYNDGSLASISCTVVSNSAGPGAVGGNSDLAYSTTIPPVGGNGGDGGGIYNTTRGSAVLQNTLVAMNAANKGGSGGTILGITATYQFFQTNGPPGTNGIGPDLAGAFTSQGFNLIGAGDGSAGFTNGVNADQVGSSAAPIDPRLGPLQMNGGPTPTHALLPGSPAIDQGKSFGVHADQRGHRRPQNFPSIPNAPGGDGSDIGAFELDIPLP